MIVFILIIILFLLHITVCEQTCFEIIQGIVNASVCAITLLNV